VKNLFLVPVLRKFGNQIAHIVTSLWECIPLEMLSSSVLGKEPSVPVFMLFVIG
jgi:hypothetical protein